MRPSRTPPFLLSPSTKAGPVAHASTQRTSKHDGEVKNVWQSSKWYSMYCAALLESKGAESLAWIASAQEAIQDRVAELNLVPAGNVHEMRALSEALDHLSILLEKSSESESTSWD